MAAAIPAGHAEWSCKLHLEPAALLPWYELCCGSPISTPASVRQSGLSRARKAVEGCWGTLNYPGVVTDWVSDRKVISATFTSSECTWKAIKNLPPTSVTWHPQTADSHPCACFELIRVFKIIPFHQSNISLALSFPAADSHPVPALSYTLINILAIEIIFPFCPPHATDSHTDPSFKPQLIHNLCLK